MRSFIYFRNLDFANIYAKYEDYYILKSSSELLGINPIKGDIFHIDAHVEESLIFLKGLDYVEKMLFFFNRELIVEGNIKFYIYSWFSEEYLKNYFKNKNKYFQDFIKFVQLPKNL